MTSEERKEVRYKRRKERREVKKKKKLLSFNELFSYENLYKSYIRCRRNVGWKASTQKYIVQAPLNVYQTRKELMNGKFRSKGFCEFDLFERGKKRKIKSVKIEERIVQRCLCDHALVPVIERSFIYKFFDNVSHDVIKEIVQKSFKDQRTIDLINHFIDCFQGNKGLGLGSQISQTLALASCNKLDHLIKEELKVKCYGRYMDDGYLIHPDKKYLKQCLNVIKEECKKLGIILNDKKTQIVKLSHGFTWLKGRFFLTPSGKIVKKIYKKSVTRERRKLKKLKKFCEAGRMTEKDAWSAFQSWRSYARHFNAYYTIKNMEELYSNLFGKERLCIRQ